jgi:hypothetical protein
MLLENNVVVSLTSGYYQVFVKGTASIYVKTSELSDFILDSTLTYSTGAFIVKQGLQVKAVFTTAEVVIL